MGIKMQFSVVKNVQWEILCDVIACVCVFNYNLLICGFSTLYVITFFPYAWFIYISFFLVRSLVLLSPFAVLSTKHFILSLDIMALCILDKAQYLQNVTRCMFYYAQKFSHRTIMTTMTTTTTNILLFMHVDDFYCRFSKNTRAHAAILFNTTKPIPIFIFIFLCSFFSP